MRTYRWGVGGVETEIREVREEDVETLHHLVPGEQLPVEVRDQAGGELSLGVVSLQRQAHGHFHDKVLVRANVHILQQVLGWSKHGG